MATLGSAAQYFVTFIFLSACMNLGNAQLRRDLTISENAFKSAKDTLETIAKGTSVLATQTDALKVWTARLSAIGQACGALGAILSFAAAFMPDYKHRAIMQQFEKLNQAVNDIRIDINELGKEVRWEAATRGLSDHVTVLKQAIHYAARIGNLNSTPSARLRAQQRLRNLNVEERVVLALRTIADTMTLPGTDYSKNVLDEYYHYTGGHRGKLVALSVHFSQLYTGGLVALIMDEAHLHRNESASELQAAIDSRKATLGAYAPKIAQAIVNITKRCEIQTEFEKHMKNDVTRVLAEEQGNVRIAERVSSIFSEKYDFLYHVVMVYDDGRHKHYCAGTYVEVFRHGKFVNVFYRRKSEGIKHWTWAQDHVQKVIWRLEGQNDARQLGVSIIEGHLELMLGYTWKSDYWAMAVFRRHRNLEVRNNFYGKIAFDWSRNFDIYIFLT